jgi:BRCA1/BRCA2-containing complex subunit 3
MSIKSAIINEDVYFICLTHALTTEKEEIMGLLLGDIHYSNIGEKGIVFIEGVSLFTRSDKKKDRVEISPELLSMASLEAEKISEKIHKKIRVIGWYHSHPHITVLPSHIDIQTQSTYQMLEKGFIGLIFSCFNKNNLDISDRIQIMAFQSSSKEKKTDIMELSNTNDEYSFYNFSLEKIEIPLYIKKNQFNEINNLEKLYLLQEILFNEEKSSYQDALKNQNNQIIHPLLKIHSQSVYQKSLCRLLELETLPMLFLFQQQQKKNIEKIIELKRKLELLKTS